MSDAPATGSAGERHRGSRRSRQGPDGSAVVGDSRIVISGVTRWSDDSGWITV